jgi:hypothetical protein
VGAARDKAPEKPGFWSKVGDFFENAGADIANFTGTVVNAAASDLNAMAHHPEDVGMIALGALGVVGGGIGLAGSGLMDATGILTIPGIAAGVGSIGLMGVGGAAMVGAPATWACMRPAMTACRRCGPTTRAREATGTSTPKDSAAAILQG